MKRFLPILILVAGCGAKAPGPAPSAAKAAPAEPWSVTTLDPSDSTPAYLSNGLIGIRIGRDGTGSGPLFAIDEYEKQGEEKIRALPNPLSLGIAAGGSDLSPSLGSDYRQTVDFRTGELKASWKQEADGRQLEVQNRTRLHPDQPWIAQQWSILVPPETRLQFRASGFAESGFSFVTSTEDRFSASFPFGPSKRNAVAEFRLNSGWEGKWSAVQGQVTWAGRSLGSKWLTLERRFLLVPEIMKSFPAWDPWEEMPADPDAADIEIDGPAEDQQAIRSFLHYLRSSIHPSGGMSVSPMGLSSSHYKGHVFWDADLWVFPALAFVAPERAAAIPSYRLKRRDLAAKNFSKWRSEGRPTATGRLGLNSLFGFEFALKFPWESSVTGKETAAGKTKFQDHVSGDVAFGLDLAAALGLADPNEAADVRRGVAGFYRRRIEENAGGTYSLPDTMSPDEFHIGDDDLYTNLVAQWCLNGGRWQDPPERSYQPPILLLPRDQTTFLAYEGDPVRHYQQTTALLAVYPLQYPQAEKEARLMLERFVPKVSPNGPAMSDSIHALIWARLGENERAYQTWRKSWMDFTRNPLLLFQEKRVKSETYFVTGAAGCLQTVIYGFLGFRIDSKPQAGAAWSTPLENGKVLSIKPNLPPAWKKVTFKNFSVLGKKYTLEATHGETRVMEPVAP